MKLARWIPMIAALLPALPAAAQDQAAPQEKKKEAFSGTLNRVKGRVQVRPPGAKKDEKVEKETRVVEGTRILTGYRSEAVLRVAESEFRILSLARLTFSRMLLKDNRASFGIRLPYGAVKIKVKESKYKVDTKVATPTSTTTIRGTVVTIRNYPDVRPWQGDLFLVHVDVEEGSVEVDGPNSLMLLYEGGRLDYTLRFLEERTGMYRRLESTPTFGGAPSMSGALIGAPGDMTILGYPAWSLPPGTSTSPAPRVTNQERTGLPLPPGPPGSSP